MVSYLFYLVAYPVLLLLSILLGRRVAARSHKKSHQWKPLGIENGLMGFYALLASFTLVQSGNNHRERVEMTHQLSDGLSELLRLTQTIDPAASQQIRTFTFQSYRIIQQAEYDTRRSVYKVIKEVEGIDKALDRYLLAYIKAYPASKTEIVNIMMKLDHLESIAYRILHSYHRRVPAFTLFVLVIFSLLMGFLLGFIGRYYNNHIHISTTIFAIISFITINFIHDLDNPSHGFIKPDFQDIADVISQYQ